MVTKFLERIIMRRFIFLAIAVYFLASGSGIFTKTPPRWLDVGIGIFLVMSNAARTRRSSMRELNETGQSAVVEPNEEQLWEINTLISEGKELEAIKRYQDQTGVKFSEAKAYVESLVKDMADESLSSARNEHSKEGLDETPKLPLPTDLEKAISTIASSDKNEAIRKVISLTGISLSEAQTYVESLDRS